MFFSSHKIGGLFNSGLVFMSNEFYDKYMSLNINEEQLYPEFTNDFLKFNGGTFDVAGFTSAYITAI